VPPDSVRCTRGIQLQLVTFGKIQSRRAIIHRTVRCSNGTRLWNSSASGFHEGCSAIIHRTCPVCTGLSGASTEQRLLRRQRLPAMHLMRAQRAQKSESPMPAHRTVNSACPVRHRTSRRAQKSELQRSDSNGTGDVAGAPDMSGVHRTVRCAIEQTASQRPLLVVGAINTPTTQPFIASKFSTSQLLTRALAFNSRHTKEIKSSPNSTQRPSDSRERFACVLSSSCAWIAFFFLDSFIAIKLTCN